MSTANERELAQLAKDPESSAAGTPCLFVAVVTGATAREVQHRSLRLVGAIADLADAVHVAAGQLEHDGHEAIAGRLRQVFRELEGSPAPLPGVGAGP